ncbi:conserved hypothetical protein [Candidatus Magnetomoraceae bacterium gMMP-15]
MLPEAHISHFTPNRIRIKVPSQRGNSDYFSRLKDNFLPQNFEKLEVNHVTGSILLTGQKVNIDSISEFAEANNLFKLVKLKAAQNMPIPLSYRVVEPIKNFDKNLLKFTGGEVDFAGIIFLSLLGVGVYQLAAGNFRFPPWYTAFWYALGVFTKLLVDKA